MTHFTRIDWLVPLVLRSLCLAQVTASRMRPLEFNSGAPIRSASARFFTAPSAAALHIVCTALFSVLTAFQFGAGLRLRYLPLHRWCEPLTMLFGLVVAFTALWSPRFYPPMPFDVAALYMSRPLAAVAMAACLAFSVTAIGWRDILRHCARMMRGYALGLGAGTRVFLHIPWFLFPGIQGELARTLCVSTGCNLAVTEWSLWGGRHARVGAPNVKLGSVLHRNAQ